MALPHIWEVEVEGAALSSECVAKAWRRGRSGQGDSLSKRSSVASATAAAAASIAEAEVRCAACVCCMNEAPRRRSVSRTRCLSRSTRFLSLTRLEVGASERLTPMLSSSFSSCVANESSCHRGKSETVAASYSKAAHRSRRGTGIARGRRGSGGMEGRPQLSVLLCRPEGGGFLEEEGARINGVASCKRNAHLLNRVMGNRSRAKRLQRLC